MSKSNIISRKSSFNTTTNSNEVVNYNTEFQNRKLVYDSLRKLKPRVGYQPLSPTNKKKQRTTSSKSKQKSQATTAPEPPVFDPQALFIPNDVLAGGTCVYTWGAGYYGQLASKGRYFEKCSKTPKKVDFAMPVVQVQSGGFFNAVVTAEGDLLTWGDARSGQTGNLERQILMTQFPTLVDQLQMAHVQVKTVACGQAHTLILSKTGEVYSWGNNKYGQLGIGSRVDQRFPCYVNLEERHGNVTHVACGDRHSCILTDTYRVLMFGSNQHGQLGFSDGTEDSIRPRSLLSIVTQRIQTIECGATFTAGVAYDGTLYIWGFGESLHPKEMLNVSPEPRCVKFKHRIVKVSCGQGHVLLLTDLGDLYAFGTGHKGQLGHGKFHYKLLVKKY